MVRNKKGNEATKATLGERQHNIQGKTATKAKRHSRQQGTESNKAQNTTQHTGLPRQQGAEDDTAAPQLARHKAECKSLRFHVEAPRSRSCAVFKARMLLLAS
jgi:hypothetical protein